MSEDEQELATAQCERCAEDECWHVRRDGTRFWAEVQRMFDELQNRVHFIPTLHGRIVLHRDHGTRFSVQFPLEGFSYDAVGISDEDARSAAAH